MTKLKQLQKTGAQDPLFYAPEQLRDLSLKVLQMARDLGATDAASEVSESSGLSVTVRKQDIETLERTRDRAVSVTVYSGLKRGHATTSDFSDQAIRDAVAKALDIARYTAEDSCAGLPEPELIAKDIPPLSLYFPWTISAEQAVALAMQAEGGPCREQGHYEHRGRILGGKSRTVLCGQYSWISRGLSVFTSLACGLANCACRRGHAAG